AYSGALLWLACCTASSACDTCDTVAAGGLPAQLLSPSAPQSRSNCITAFLLVIEYLHSKPPFHTISRRLLAYLFFVRKPFVNPACIEALACYMAVITPVQQFSCHTSTGPPGPLPGTGNCPDGLYRHWRVWHTRPMHPPARTGAQTWRQLALSG